MINSLIKKLEIVKPKPTLIISVLKVDIIKVGLVLSSAFFYLGSPGTGTEDIVPYKTTTNVITVGTCCIVKNDDRKRSRSFHYSPQSKSF